MQLFLCFHTSQSVRIMSVFKISVVHCLHFWSLGSWHYQSKCFLWLSHNTYYLQSFSSHSFNLSWIHFLTCRLFGVSIDFVIVVPFHDWSNVGLTSSFSNLLSIWGLYWFWQCGTFSLLFWCGATKHVISFLIFAVCPDQSFFFFSDLSDCCSWCLILQWALNFLSLCLPYTAAILQVLEVVV